MQINRNKYNQDERLKEICTLQGVDYNSLLSLLESTKAKKIKRNNYHQQKIVDTIEKVTK